MIRVRIWKEDDGWQLDITGSPAEEGIGEPPFPTAHAAKRAWRHLVSAMQDARFEVLDERPADLDEDDE